MYILILTFLVFLFIGLNVLYVDTEQASIQEGSKEESIYQAFTNPQWLCNNLLSDQGFESTTESGWSQFQGIYSCVSELEVTAGESKYIGDLSNIIEFSVESKSRDHVDRITLAANIFNVKKEKQVLDRFVNLIDLLFQRLEIDQPEGLGTKVQQQQPARYELEIGTIEVSRETYKFGHGLILVIRRLQ